MSLLKTKIARLPEGAYMARVSSYQEVNMDSGGGEYVVITLEIETGDCYQTETDWVSPKRIPYVADALQDQFDKDFESFEALLKFAKDHDFTITYKKDERYGKQFSYKG